MGPLILPSASSLTRVKACIDSERLRPRVFEESSVDAKRGVTLDAFVRALGRGTPRDVALSAVPEDDENRKACEELDQDAIPRGGHFEVALAWNHQTGAGRILGYDLERDYSEANRAVEYVGSFDYAGTLSPVHGVLADWKSGWFTIPARRSWQLKLGAVAGAAVWGWERVTTAHLDLRDPSRPRWDRHEMDEMALASARAELRALAAELGTDRAPENFREGEHCRYCPAFLSCPAKTALTRQLALTTFVGGEGLVPPDMTAMTPEVAAKVWKTLERYDEIAKRARRQIEKQAARAPVDLGDGRVLRLALGDGRDKVVDALGAIDVARNAFGDNIAKLAIKTTKTALVEAAKSWARVVGAKVGATEEQFLLTLRGAGLLVESVGEEKVRIVRAEETQ